MNPPPLSPLPPLPPLIDVSAFAGTWPFRKLRGAPAEVKADLQAAGVRRAWLAPLAGIFRLDPTEDNLELLEQARGDAFFAPVAILNPAAPGWERQAERAHSAGFHAWKLAPNYQRYDLAGDAAQKLAALSAQCGVPLCIQMRMQDERGHPREMMAPGVPAQAIAALAQRVPEARIVACAPYIKDLPALAQAPNIWIEISFCESGRTLADVLKHIPAERALFASHAPLHYPAAEAAKLRGALDVPPETLARIAIENASVLGVFHCT